MFNSLDIGASALRAQRIRMDTIAGNVANINTTRNAQGQLEPYRRRIVNFAVGSDQASGQPGVHVAGISQDPAPFLRKYEPWSPDADPSGYVSYPNIELAIEYVNMLEASRAYEASVTMMETTKAMINSSLRLIA